MNTSTRPESSSSALAFPQRKAFVLQFAAEAGPDSGLFCGRIEHVTSGDQASFRSTQELWEFVRGVLTSPSHRVTDDRGAMPALRAAG